MVQFKPITQVTYLLMMTSVCASFSELAMMKSWNNVS